MKRESRTIQMAHTAAVKKHDVVLDDGFAMVALNDAEANELIAYGVAGSFDFVGASGNTLKVGNKAYYIEADKKVTHVATGNVFIGRVVMLDGGNVEVKINTGV